MDLGKFWSDLKFSAEAFVINDLKSCFPVISRPRGSNFFQVDLSLKIWDIAGTPMMNMNHYIEQPWKLCLTL